MSELHTRLGRSSSSQVGHEFPILDAIRREPGAVGNSMHAGESPDADAGDGRWWDEQHEYVRAAWVQSGASGEDGLMPTGRGAFERFDGGSHSGWGFGSPRLISFAVGESESLIACEAA